jgi:hypothetical protein
MEKNLNMSYQVIFLAVLCVVLVPVCGFAAHGETLHVLKISPQDQRAVIRQADGKMQIVKVGDAVGATGKIIEISEGRVVIEEVSNNETERIIIRLENGKQRVERLKKTADKQPPLYSPNTQKQNGK